MNAKAIALLAEHACDEKQGAHPLILDVRKITDVTDYFLLVNGNSDRHVRTIADHIVDLLREKGVKPHHVEGMTGAKWVLLDYGDVIVHVFYHETRQFYNLERLWGDAKQLRKVKKDEKRTKKAH